MINGGLPRGSVAGTLGRAAAWGVMVLGAV